MPPRQKFRPAYPFALLVPLLAAPTADGGSLSVTGGQSVSVGGYFGHDAQGGADVLTVDGPGSVLSSTGSLSISGDATYGIVTNGGQVTVKDTTSLASLSGATPSLSLDGAGTTWRTAELDMFDAAYLKITGGAKLYALTGITAYNPDDVSPGVVRIDVNGPGSALAVAGAAYLGAQKSSVAVMNVTNGGQVIGGEFRAGYYGRRDDVTVDGPGSIWETTGDFYLANRAALNLTISNGGTVRAGASMIFGYGSDVPGVQPATATLTGPGSSLSAAALYFGGPVYGTGVLTVADHATLSSSQIIQIRNSPGCLLTLAEGTVSTPILDVAGSFDMTGGTLLATQIIAGPNFHATGGTIRLPFGGSLAVPAAGLTIGSELVNRGTVAGPTSPAARLDFTGDVSGPGNFTGRVAFDATFSPGNEDTVATVSFDAATFLPTDTLTMDVLIPSYSDQLHFASVATLGGTLNLHPLYGFSPLAGDTFSLFSGPFTGTFAHLNLPFLPGNLSWNTSSLYTNGTLSVTPEPDTIVVGLILIPLLRRPNISRSYESPIA